MATIAITTPSPRIPEGNGGRSTATIGFELSGAVSEPVVFEYRVTGGSAVRGSDFDAASGVVRFEPFALRTEIAFDVIGDRLSEPDEFFTIDFSNPRVEGAEDLGDLVRFAGNSPFASVSVTIIDDDGLPTPQIADRAFIEGHEGSRQVVFPITLSEAIDIPTTLRFRFDGATAQRGEDFTGGDGFLEIPAGETRASLAATILGDDEREFDERFTLTLSATGGRGFTNGQSSVTATAIIADDDDVTQPLFEIADAVVTEGDGGETLLRIPYRVSEPPREDPNAPATDPPFVPVTFAPASLRFETVAGTAQPGQDFRAQSGVLDIPTGTTDGVIEIPIIADTLDELTETFALRLFAADRIDFATGAAEQTVAITILDDDTATPVLTISGFEIIEGDSGNQSRSITLVSDRLVTRDVSVAYTFFEDSATLGSDFAAESGVVVIPAGSDRAAIPVTLFGDTEIETDETIRLSLFEPEGAVFAAGGETVQVNVTILDDDSPPRLLPPVAEEVIEGGVLSLTLRLDRPAETPVSVAFASEDGSATGGTDFIIAGGRATFQAGADSTQVLLETVTDTVVEGRETLTLRFSDPDGVILPADAAAVTLGIVDFDTGPGEEDVLEGSAGDDSLVGGPGDDVIRESGGDDTIAGGDGFDRLELADDAADYVITRVDEEILLVTGDGGALTLTGIEVIQFADASLAFGATAGALFRLYGAALDRSPDDLGMAYWLGLAAAGQSLRETADFFLQSSEFADRFGAGLDASGFLDRLYNNVLERDADLAGEEYWLEQLAAGIGRPDVLLAFVNSPENISRNADAVALGIPLDPAGFELIG